MNALAGEPTLRPLGIGEILDRGVNLTVKNFVPLSLIFLVYAAPAAILQYYATKDFSRIMQALTDSLQVHGAGSKPDMTASSSRTAWRRTTCRCRRRS